MIDVTLVLRSVFSVAEEREEIKDIQSGKFRWGYDFVWRGNRC